MADQHPGEDRLLELALGEVGEPECDELTRHLVSCPQCREEYDAVSTSIDATLPAGPRIEPPLGFDRRALEAMRTGRRGSPRAMVVAAAAALVGMALGAGATVTLTGQDPPVPPAETRLASGTALTTDVGTRVGTVTESWLEGEPVLVVDVTDGSEGSTYTCRVVLAGGGTRDVGVWTLESGRPNSWVVPAPEPGVQTVQLVADAGVWSSADL